MEKKEKTSMFYVQVQVKDMLRRKRGDGNNTNIHTMQYNLILIFNQMRAL